MCDPTTNRASFSSSTASAVSRITHMISNLDKMGSVKLTFSANGTSGLYFPRAGLAAAMIEQRACNVVTIPALDIEMDCCSIASWIEVLRMLFLAHASTLANTGIVVTMRYTDHCLSSCQTRRSSIRLCPLILERPHLRTT